MAPIEPLITLLEQTERERDAAMAMMLRHREAHHAAQAQADQLLEYRGDYERRFATQFREAGSIEMVRVYQGFVGRLSQAVEQQTQIAQRSKVQYERSREILREHEVRVASVRKLIEGRMRELQRETDRREQKASDELAMRAAWTRLAAATRPAPLH